MVAKVDKSIKIPSHSYVLKCPLVIEARHHIFASYISFFAVKDLFRIIDKADDHLLSELGRVLGLTTMKLQELQQSARTMARADTRRRVWGHPDFPNIRLLYPCEAGAPLMGAQDIGNLSKIILILPPSFSLLFILLSQISNRVCF